MHQDVSGNLVRAHCTFWEPCCPKGLERGVELAAGFLHPAATQGMTARVHGGV